MNGKKAKLHRKLAGMSAHTETTYAVEERTRRKIPIYQRSETGGMVLGIDGLPIQVGTIETKTMRLDKCARQVYQALKRMYKTKSKLANA